MTTDTPAKSSRLMSLDALRGFDMFWILGADAVVRGFARAVSYKPLDIVAGQFTHSAWEGLTAYDVIFPLFVFIVGVSLVFSLTKQLATGNKRAALRRVIVRSIVLYLWGIVYYGGFSKDFSDIRLMGVLQRIALCYLFTSLMFIYLRPRTMAIIAIVILLGYWLVLAFVPVPGVGHASFAERENWPNYFDAHFLSGHKYDGDHDPEGPLSTPPAVVTCMLGMFAGLLLKSGRSGAWSKIAILIVAGAASAALGYAWGHHFAAAPVLCFPIIKKIWTSSFVLVTAGFGAILLGLFFMIIDVWKLQYWARPFVWIGANAITLYLIEDLIDLRSIARRFIGGELGGHIFRSYESAAINLLALLFLLLLARFLYKRQIFLRV